MKILESFPILVDAWRSDDSRSVPLISGLHSGNLGDIVYSLPTCDLLGINHLILNICHDPGFGGRVLTESGARALVPLLLEQPGLQRVTIIRSQVPWEYVSGEDIGITHNLDSFRLNISASPNLHLVYQHGVPFGLRPDANKKWLDVENTRRVPEKYLVIGLTRRYRRFEREYYERLLRDVPGERIFFVGLEADQIERLNIQGNSLVAKDHLELAQLIKGSALFIGNPSFPYAIAEGLKVRRMVELPTNNNVYPLDSSGIVLHMHNVDYLRETIFDSLGLNSHSARVIPMLQIRAEKAEQELSELRFKIHLLKRALKLHLPSLFKLIALKSPTFSRVATKLAVGKTRWQD